MKKALILAAILSLTGCEHTRRLTGTATPTQPKIWVGMGQSNMARFSPAGEQSFLAHMPEGTAFINCGVGATYLSEWSTDGKLFNDCEERVNVYQKVYGGALAGILFYQGEQDALDDAKSTVQDYGATLIRTFDSYRVRFHNNRLPIIFCQLNTTNGGEYATPTWDVIKAAQATVVEPFTKMIATAGLPLRDHVHLSDAGYRILGAMYADRAKP